MKNIPYLWISVLEYIEIDLHSIELDLINLKVAFHQIADLDEESVAEQIATCLGNSDSEVLHAS
jgi:hypothetical protein